MLKTSILLLVACLVLIQGKNEKGLTLDQVLDKLMADLNKNRDDVVNDADISKDLKTKWDSNGDGCLSRKEFEKQWVDSYHYDVDTINLFFSRLDIDQDGCLNSTDADMHRYAIDTNHASRRFSSIQTQRTLTPLIIVPYIIVEILFFKVL